MAKKLNLTVAERLKALNILNDFRGNLLDLSVIIEDVKQFPITPEELEKIGGKTSVSEEGRQTLQWDAQKECEIDKEISIQERTVDYIKRTIKEKGEKNELSLNDSALLTLLEKLNG